MKPQIFGSFRKSGSFINIEQHVHPLASGRCGTWQPPSEPPLEGSMVTRGPCGAGGAGDRPAPGSADAERRSQCSRLLLSLVPVTRTAAVLKPKSSGIFLESDRKLLRVFQTVALVMTTWLSCLAIKVPRRLLEDKEAASFYAQKTGLFSSFFKGTPNP